MAAILAQHRTPQCTAVRSDTKYHCLGSATRIELMKYYFPIAKNIVTVLFFFLAMFLILTKIAQSVIFSSMFSNHFIVTHNWNYSIVKISKTYSIQKIILLVMAPQLTICAIYVPRYSRISIHQVNTMSNKSRPKF